MLAKMRFLIVLVLVVVLAGSVAAQEAEGKVRLVQIVYENADIWVDDVAAVESLGYSFTTDYWALSAGTHSITVTPAGEDAEAGISLDLDVEADHSYALITMVGTETQPAHLMVIDETTRLGAVEQTGSDAIIVQNVPGAPPVDVHFIDKLVIEDLIYPGYGVAGAPLGAFKARATPAGNPDATLFEADYFAVEGTTALAYLAGTFPADITRYFFVTGTANLRDYLTAHTALENSSLTTFFAALTATGLADTLADESAGEPAFTVFAPNNAAFESLPEGTLAGLMTNADALKATIGYHISPTYALPQSIVGENTLETLAGVPLNITIEAGKSFTINGTANVLLQMRMGNGVIYVIDSVLTPPA